MIILSLFDGCAGALTALKRAGIKVDKYYASEIDKFAMQIAIKNHPEIIQLGDINKWKEWNIEKPDLIIGGSPCQGFSFAGKQLNFKDERSRLFFEFVKIKNHYDPEFFLLENVKMKKEYQDIISGLLGVEPVEINSALVSAQNRKRLYWCNWKIEQPRDKGILLKDIIEDALPTNSMVVLKNKSQAILSTIHKENVKSMTKRGKTGLYVGGIKNRGRWKEKGDKSQCLDANYWKGIDNRGQRTCIQVGEANVKGFEQNKRVYSPKGKSPTLSSSQGGYREPKIEGNEVHWRKLTPLECERLQTLPDNYTEGVSNTQRYKMLGNGFTVDVITHILRGIL